jgi:hypothetical protein
LISLSDNDMTKEIITKIFTATSRVIKEALDNNTNNAVADKLRQAIILAVQKNPWFTVSSVNQSLQAWAEVLNEAHCMEWLSAYPSDENRKPKNVAIVMAGNIPLVGFHDYLCCLATGHNALIKLSSDDEVLLPVIYEIMCSFSSEIKRRVTFSKSPLKNFDAVIATGSNNTSRYFVYYFGKYPHIIRKSRNSVAVLTGDESAEELLGVAHDIFDYFGLGCRSVSKLYVPVHYNFDKLLATFDHFDDVAAHTKYMNNYNYQKSILIINGIPFMDHRNILIREEDSIASPVALLHYSQYRSLVEVNRAIQHRKDQIQVVVSNSVTIKDAILPGTTQNPGLFDYADGIDTMDFLNSI